jgi:pyruvate/2-oxoglutarate dehydrogenase complex dihydrolipoamide acyltransferase (E2) component
VPRLILPFTLAYDHRVIDGAGGVRFTTFLAERLADVKRPAGSRAVTRVVVPDLGDFKDVEVIDVLVKPGDTVQLETPLITLETEKATMDVPSVCRRRREIRGGEEGAIACRRAARSSKLKGNSLQPRSNRSRPAPAAAPKPAEAPNGPRSPQARRSSHAC